MVRLADVSSYVDKGEEDFEARVLSAPKAKATVRVKDLTDGPCDRLVELDVLLERDLGACRIESHEKVQTRSRRKRAHDAVEGGGPCEGS